jgi:spermidine/putrescine-binding protein
VKGSRFAKKFEPRPTLAVLTALGRLDPQVVSEFEASRKVNVRVEFATSSADYESKIRSSPHTWDVVIADEQKLASLHFSKLTRPVTSLVKMARKKNTLEEQGKYEQGESLFVPLFADPLGLAWLSGELSVSPSESPNWNWIVEIHKNPLLRSQVALPENSSLQILIACLSNGVTLPLEEGASLKESVEWLKKARHQAVKSKEMNVQNALLTETAKLGVLWQSQFVRLKKMIPDLQFGVPSPRSFVERHGAALVTDTLQEKIATDFQLHLYSNADRLAKSAGLVSLKSTSGLQKGESKLLILPDFLPVPSSVEMLFLKAMLLNK